jgi:hypothetical protein
VPSREVTTTQVTGVLFGFYSSEEVRGRTSGEGYACGWEPFQNVLGDPMLLLCLHCSLLSPLTFYGHTPLVSEVTWELQNTYFPDVRDSVNWPGNGRDYDFLRCMFYVQVKKLSVKQITSPVVFDNVQNAIPGGLYDPAMGPYNPNGGRWVLVPGLGCAAGLTERLGRVTSKVVEMHT